MVVIYDQCPYCAMKGRVTSALDEIYMAWRTCERCGKEFLIVKNRPMKTEDYVKSGWVAHLIPISVLLSNSHNLGAQFPPTP